MADEEKTKKKKEKKAKPEKTEGESGKGGFIGRLLPWVTMIVFVGVSAGAGFGLGRIFAGTTAASSLDPNASQAAAEAAKAPEGENDPEKTVAKDLPTVVATLDEPGLTRYLRVTITMNLFEREDVDPDALMTEKSPELVNWLNLFLASQTLEDVRGDRNLRRLQMQILDGFNEIMAPKAKPVVKAILFKDIAIQ